MEFVHKITLSKYRSSSPALGDHFVVWVETNPPLPFADIEMTWKCNPDSHPNEAYVKPVKVTPPIIEDLVETSSGRQFNRTDENGCCHFRVLKGDFSIEVQAVDIDLCLKVVDVLRLSDLENMQLYILDQIMAIPQESDEVELPRVENPEPENTRPPLSGAEYIHYRTAEVESKIRRSIGPDALDQPDVVLFDLQQVLNHSPDQTLIDQLRKDVDAFSADSLPEGANVERNHMSGPDDKGSAPPKVEPLDLDPEKTDGGQHGQSTLVLKKTQLRRQSKPGSQGAGTLGGSIPNFPATNQEPITAVGEIDPLKQPALTSPPLPLGELPDNLPAPVVDRTEEPTNVGPSPYLTGNRPLSTSGDETTDQVIMRPGDALNGQTAFSDSAQVFIQENQAGDEEEDVELEDDELDEDQDTDLDVEDEETHREPPPQARPIAAAAPSPNLSATLSQNSYLAPRQKTGDKGVIVAFVGILLLIVIAFFIGDSESDPEKVKVVSVNELAQKDSAGKTGNAPTGAGDKASNGVEIVPIPDPAPEIEITKRDPTPAVEDADEGDEDAAGAEGEVAAEQKPEEDEPEPAVEADLPEGDGIEEADSEEDTEEEDDLDESEDESEEDEADFSCTFYHPTKGKVDFPYFDDGGFNCKGKILLTCSDDQVYCGDELTVLQSVDSGEWNSDSLNKVD